MAGNRPRRIDILGVPVDILPEAEFEDIVSPLFADSRNHQIMLLSVWDLLRAKYSGEWRTMANGASVIVPISSSVVKAAKFLKKPLPVRYEPFDFLVRSLDILDRQGKSVYLLGSTPRALARAEKNLRATFPRLRIVGRHAGYYRKAYQPSIIEAIRKATPSLLLVGYGVPGKERWIPRSLKYFNAGGHVWCSDVLDVFAERKRRVSPALFARSLEWLPYTFAKPWRVYRAFLFLWFKILVLFARIRGR